MKKSVDRSMNLMRIHHWKSRSSALAQKFWRTQEISGVSCASGLAGNAWFFATSLNESHCFQTALLSIAWAPPLRQGGLRVRAARQSWKQLPSITVEAWGTGEAVYCRAEEESQKVKSVWC
jgi:hypothetical protein